VRDVNPNDRSPKSEPASLLAVRSCKRALLSELTHSHENGNPVTPEDLLARWPDKPCDPDIASLLFEDYQQQRRRGSAPQLSNYEERFPQQADSLRSLVRQNDLLRSLGGSCPSGLTLRLPDVGDEVFGFKLRHELGRGAFARVFLGEQKELAGRPVVLKVTATDNDEPQTLAQLQHTHIVPVYSAHADDNAGLRLVCMPYFGGASLSSVLRAVTAECKQPTHGAQLVQGLQIVQAPTLDALRLETTPPYATIPPSAAAPAPARQAAPLERLKGMTYVQASVWIVARLAEALQHAHERGIYHRDVKPSNILLSSDGEPMLLDFNLATSISTDAGKATVGGTVAYMAPEHLRAMASRNPMLARQVDHRADIYSLGMVLFEMLVGERPFEQSASYAPLPALIEAMAVERSQSTPSLRQHRKDVPWGLESIVRRCLAPDPALRYQHASELAADLDALLEDRPLRHAPELSVKERAQKWLRRHPRLASSSLIAGVAAALLITAGIVVLDIRQQAHATHEQLEDALVAERDRRFDEGVRRALCLVNTTTDLPGSDHLAQGIAACEQTLALYGVLTSDQWQENESWRRLASVEREENARELLLLLARGRVQQTPDDPRTLRGALRLLDKAEALRRLPPTPALWEDRADYLDRLGAKEQAHAARGKAKSLKPATARDYCLLAASLVRRDGVHTRQAIEALEEALALNPKHYWAYVQRGVLRMQRGENALAAADFGSAVGLWPEYALGYFNLGCALLRAGQPDDAVAQFTLALEREPSFVLARLNRGLTLLERGRYQQALADFEKAHQDGCEQAAAWAGRGVALEKLKRHEEADTVFATALERARTEAEAVQLRVGWVYAFAVSERLPHQAARIFSDILDKHPDHPQALYGQAMLAAQQDDLDRALKCFDRALDVDPSLTDARRFRAVLLARRGRLGDAQREINACLSQEPRNGATLYAAACVAARAVEHGDPASAPAALEQTLQFLEHAFAAGYGRDKVGTDPDLAGVRDLPAFRRWLDRQATIAPNDVPNRMSPNAPTRGIVP
jgi:eukaryotic-like serine/threonine-protein kinase